MKAVLISIKPEWCNLIVKRKKTMELRKTKPKQKTPFKCYIYCTAGELLTKSHNNGGIYIAINRKYKERLEKNGNITLSGKVIGEFICDYIEDFSEWKYDYAALLRHIDLYAATHGDYKFLSEYLPEKKGYGWNISDLVIYETPKGLNEFNGKKRPPQSWCYVEENT